MASLIGLAGKARSGKDTLANRLQLYGWRRLAFADRLKLVTATLAGEPQNLYHDDLTKEQFSQALGTTRRAALQGLGKAVRDVLDPGIWVRTVLAAWESGGRAPTVISDVRYDNEAQVIRSVGGIVVEVVRPGAGLAGAAAQHESERGVSEGLVDIEILNDGTLGELFCEAQKLSVYMHRREAS